MNAHIDRRQLPYRDKAEAFLLTPDGSVLAQDRQQYIMFPGGGIDAGEDASQALIREVREETGYAVHEMTLLGVVAWDWFPAWANTPTRQTRYRKFRGERVHLFGGLVSDRQTSSAVEQDAWSGSALMPLDRCLTLSACYAQSDHPNTYAYRVAQEMAIRCLRWLHLRNANC